MYKNRIGGVSVGRAGQWSRSEQLPVLHRQIAAAWGVSHLL